MMRTAIELIIFAICIQYAIIVLILAMGIIRTKKQLAYNFIPFYWVYIFVKEAIKNIKALN